MPKDMTRGVVGSLDHSPALESQPPASPRWAPSRAGPVPVLQGTEVSSRHTHSASATSHTSRRVTEACHLTLSDFGFHICKMGH